MSYGNMMDGNTGPNYGKVNLNKNPDDKSVDMSIHGTIPEMTYSDERDIAMELNLAKIEQDLIENKEKFNKLERKIDHDQQDFNYLTNKIIEAERNKLTIIDNDPVLEEIKGKVIDDGLFENMESFPDDPNNYKLLGERNARLGIINMDPGIDKYEIDMWERQAKELDGDIYYNRKQLNKLKKLIEKDTERLNDGQEVANLGDDISVWE